MNKLILAITLTAVVAAALPANAAPRNASMNMSASSTIKVGQQCFKPTDQGRGYGFWTSCDQVYAFALAYPQLTINSVIEPGGGTDGGGGGGGSGGGGNR